ncbi:MAG: NPCBM/NEW2 domain-containing protein [Oscillospiraceae bacterium]|nr:NPCBM/NEW2 domain-containing protein [Oscillospiraceae bacterium]
MSEINMKGNRNKVVVNSTVAIIAVLIAIVAIVWITNDENGAADHSVIITETVESHVPESEAMYANDVLTAYNLDLVTQYSEAWDTGGASFQMAGKKYENGVVFSCHDRNFDIFDASITYNVEGYSKISFYFGHEDNTEMVPMELKVYLDNEFYESYSMEPDDVPRQIEIDVTGKKTIWFGTSVMKIGTGYCLADLMVE